MSQPANPLESPMAWLWRTLAEQIGQDATDALHLGYNRQANLYAVQRNLANARRNLIRAQQAERKDGTYRSFRLSPAHYEKQIAYYERRLQEMQQEHSDVDSRG